MAIVRQITQQQRDEIIDLMPLPDSTQAVSGASCCTGPTTDASVPIDPVPGVEINGTFPARIPALAAMDAVIP
jgi:hypothetical protein